MKPRRSTLASLARTLPASLLVPVLLAGGCRNAPTHWDPDFAPERASYHMLGANGYSSETISQVTRDSSRDMVLTMRRHFLNDNPDNPMQRHRDPTFGHYVPIWDMPKDAILDTADIVAYTTVRAGQGVWSSLVMIPQLFLGTSDVEHYDAPPPVSEFEVKNR